MFVRKANCKRKHRHVKEYFSVLVRYFFCKAEISPHFYVKNFLFMILYSLMMSTLSYPKHVAVIQKIMLCV